MLSRMFEYLDALFTKEEERDVLKKLDEFINQIPPAERHVSMANHFCINRCLYDAVQKKYPPRKDLNMTVIPEEKQPLYEKISNTVAECVRSCRVPPGYRRFLMKLVEMILSPDRYTLNLNDKDNF